MTSGRCGASYVDAPVPTLVDAFATRALDDLREPLDALACGRKRSIPGRCEQLIPLLIDLERVRAVERHAARHARRGLARARPPLL